VIKILIADDNELIRRGLRRLLQTHDGWEVCGEASSGQEAIQKSRELAPDAIVLDFLMPGLNGIETAWEIAEISPKIPILLWTLYASPQILDMARSAGITAVLPKGNVSELFSGLETVLGGGTFYAPLPAQ
jgi:DNA-binding NarL/FixJ family response regulator